MWHKTFAGLFSGLIFLLFVPTALSLFAPTFTALMITLSIVLLIPAWAGIMTHCYAAQSNKQAWFRAVKYSLPSGLLYFCAYLIMGFPLGLSAQ